MKAELHRRSIVKAVTYRVVGTVGTWLVSWAITGEVWIGLSIGLADAVLKVLFYYFHERAWHRVTWGVVTTDASKDIGGGI